MPPALAFFGGVPRQIVLDNPKAGVAPKNGSCTAWRCYETPSCSLAPNRGGQLGTGRPSSLMGAAEVSALQVDLKHCHVIGRGTVMKNLTVCHD
jgi:hypothetical protein